MTLDLFKAQAHRLQAFLKSHPEKARDLANAKQSTCYDMVAAMHGARNWNTLCADAQKAPAPPEGSTITRTADLADLMAGEVGMLIGRSGVGKSHTVTAEVVRSLAQGQSVTVLDIGRSYYHCTESMGGANTRIEEFDCNSVRLPQLLQSLETAHLATVELERAIQGLPGISIAKAWGALEPAIMGRLQPGHLLVVDEVWAVLRAFAEQAHLLIGFLVAARKRGCRIVLVAQSTEDLCTLEHVLPATVVIKQEWSSADTRTSTCVHPRKSAETARLSQA
jgi:hypothetical protein